MSNQIGEVSEQARGNRMPYVSKGTSSKLPNFQILKHIKIILGAKGITLRDSVEHWAVIVYKLGVSMLESV